MSRSYAKVNLILNLGERGASGRFDAHFIMQEIGLYDEIGISSLPDGGIVIECDDPSVPTDEKNLCYKAVQIMREVSGRQDGVKILLAKKIPSAGGLGGGSGNAAFVIRALNEKWKVGLTDDELIEKINPVLGTDASFFIKGGTADVRSNGLNVDPISTNLKIPYVSVMPDVKVPSDKTAKVYKHFRPEKVVSRPDIDGMISALMSGSLERVALLLFNAFEYSLPPHYAPVIDAKEKLIGAGCLNAVMCGAGPTVFGICRSSDEARRISGELQSRYPQTFVTGTRLVIQ